MSRQQHLLSELLPQTLTLEEEVCAVYGCGEHKTLKVICTYRRDGKEVREVKYQVIVHRELAWEGEILENAVAFYNSVTPRTSD